MLTAENQISLDIPDRLHMGAVINSGVWRIRTNTEDYELHGEPDIITVIKQGRLHLSGHVQRMEENRTLKEVSVAH
ncbi:hypothetical protein J437_LFUL006815 [Ladona fulva]|uniref:Uncharacterized protein n=1 Tax=Ladona fulva TaxID=123851 RepID=A0A8K0P267_LADFU|nr:hypothetical protein J437_LFUL006815 [Ladona fulva]